MATDILESTKERHRSSVVRRTLAVIDHVPNRVWTVLAGVAIILFAEIAANSGWISTFILPAPSDVARSLRDGFSNGLYWPHIRATVFPTLAGFLLAATSGVTMGALLGSLARLESIIFPYVVAFQTVPKLAIAPMVVLWLGFGAEGKILIVSMVAFFPILVNTIHGMRVRQSEFNELALSLGASSWQMFRHIRFPGAIPYIMAGLHIGVILALIGAVVAEFVGSRSGLGYILLQQKAAFNIPGAFAIILLLSAIGLTNNALMTLLERRLAFWGSEDVTRAGGA